MLDRERSREAEVSEAICEAKSPREVAVGHLATRVMMWLHVVVLRLDRLSEAGILGETRLAKSV